MKVMLRPANQSTANVTILSLHHPHLPQLILVGFTLLSIIIITILGNVLVMISLSRFKALRTVSNLLIGNLAVSDFLLATTVLPFSAVYECLGRSELIIDRLKVNTLLVSVDAITRIVLQSLSR